MQSLDEPNPKNTNDTMRGIIHENGSNGRSVQKLKLAEREALAVKLRVSGKSWGYIAEQIGCTYRSAIRTYQRAVDKIVPDAVASVRKEINATLPYLIGAIWSDAIGGDNAKIKTILAALRLKAEINGVFNAAPEGTNPFATGKCLVIQTNQIVNVGTQDGGGESAWVDIVNPEDAIEVDSDEEKD